MLTDAWPTHPILRGTDPLPALEHLNATNPERRLIAAVSLAAILVCVPSFVALLVTMPTPDAALDQIAPPQTATSEPAPLEPLMPLMPQSPPPEPSVSAAEPVVSGAAVPESSDALKKAHRAKRHKKSLGNTEGNPPSKGVRLADDDGAGEELKRPAF